MLDWFYQQDPHPALEGIMSEELRTLAARVTHASSGAEFEKASAEFEAAKKAAQDDNARHSDD